MSNLLWILLQEYPEEAAEAAEHTPNVFNLSMGVSFWAVVIFLALFAVLAKFAFPPILGYAEAREKRIQESLDEAKRTRAEAAALVEEQRRELQKAREESQRMIGEGKQAAEKVREQMLADARAEQEQILERARAEIGRERQQAVEQVRREAVDVALAAAARLVEKRMDAAEDRRLVQEFLSEGAGGAR